MKLRSCDLKPTDYHRKTSNPDFKSFATSVNGRFLIRLFLNLRVCKIKNSSEMIRLTYDGEYERKLFHTLRCIKI